MFDFQRINRQYQDDFDALRSEVHTLAKKFRDTGFFGDRRHFPHAHYGYLMACMGRVDQYSAFWQGTVQADRSDQTQRMIDFLATFVYPLSCHECVHSVLVQMFRHSLMHTGALRFVFDRNENAAYTWRVYFGMLPHGIEHYPITTVDPQHQDQLLSAALAHGYQVKKTRAINISVPLLATGIYQGVARYMLSLRESQDLQRRFLAAEADMVIQTFRQRMPTATMDRVSG